MTRSKTALLFSALALTFSLGSAPAFAHHMAEDTIDADLWETIDEQLADTPHADLVLL